MIDPDDIDVKSVINHRKLGPGWHILFCPGCFERSMHVVIRGERQTFNGKEPPSMQVSCDACCISREYTINGDEI